MGQDGPTRDLCPWVLAVVDVAVPPAQGSSSTSEVRPGSLIPELLLPGPAVSPGRFLISGLGFSFGCFVYGEINDTIRRPDLVCWEGGEA